MTARLAEIDGIKFLDLHPGEFMPKANKFEKFHLLPIHTVYVVKQTEPRLELATIDYQWLDRYLSEHPGAIEHIDVDGRKVLTASTAKVQEFLVEHHQMFSGEVVLQRVTGN